MVSAQNLRCLKLQAHELQISVYCPGQKSQIIFQQNPLLSKYNCNQNISSNSQLQSHCSRRSRESERTAAEATIYTDNDIITPKLRNQHKFSLLSMKCEAQFHVTGWLLLRHSKGSWQWKKWHFHPPLHPEGCQISDPESIFNSCCLALLSLS